MNATTSRDRVKQAYTILGLVSLLFIVALLIVFCIRLFFATSRRNQEKEQIARSTTEHLLISKTHLPDISEKLTSLSAEVARISRQLKDKSTRKTKRSKRQSDDE